MKLKYILPGILLVALVACNKGKRKMKGLVGNWRIEQSERAVIGTSGSEDFYEDITDCGELVISEDENESKEMKNFTFRYVNQNGDTLKMEGILTSDEKNKRIVFRDVLVGDTATGNYTNLIWTVDKEKKNKQVWSAYGVDSTFFYPTNKFNPEDANNWLMWRITLKRDKGGISGS